MSLRGNALSSPGVEGARRSPLRTPTSALALALCSLGSEASAQQLQVEGAVAVTEDELRRSCDDTLRATQDEETARHCLLAVYYDRGYVSADVRSGPDAHFLVTEGPRFRLRRVHAREVDAQGHDVAALGARGELDRRVHGTAGDWFSRGAIGRDVIDVQTWYRDAGYASVEVRPDVQVLPATHEVDLELRVVRGPRMRVEEVRIDGSSRVPEARLRRQVAVREGALYNETALQQTRRALLATGSFERVDVSTEAVRDRPDRVIVHVEVVDRATTVAGP